MQRQLPLGGEDLNRYFGPSRLVRATGEESFDTVSDGADVLALYIMDVLDPMTDDAVQAAADDLIGHLSAGMAIRTRQR